MSSGGKIFRLVDGGELMPLAESAYATEDILQELIAKYPDLLAGDQMDTDSPRRWVLIRREYPVSFSEEPGDCGSLDHLLLDQDAVPTLVEVKRSSNSEIRRKVVGQLLDYAAGITAAKSSHRIREEFERECANNGRSPEDVLREDLGIEDSSAFWQKVDANLTVGRIRLLFVADKIPTQLRRIIDYLNASMELAEVLGVEIKMFQGDGCKTLVPIVIGASAQLEDKRREQRSWTSKMFFEKAETLFDAGQLKALRDIHQWICERYGDNPSIFGRGSEYGSLGPEHVHEGKRFKLFYIDSSGYVWIYLTKLRGLPALATDSAEFTRRLHLVTGAPPAITPSGWVRITLSSLADENSRRVFMDLIEYIHSKLG